MVDFPGIPVTTMIADLRGRFLDTSGNRLTPAQCLDGLNAAQRELAALLPVSALADITHSEDVSESTATLAQSDLARPFMRLAGLTRASDGVSFNIVYQSELDQYRNTLRAPTVDSPIVTPTGRGLVLTPAPTAATTLTVAYLWVPRKMEEGVAISSYAFATNSTFVRVSDFGIDDYYNGMHIFNETSLDWFTVGDYTGSTNTFTVTGTNIGWANDEKVTIEPELGAALHPLLVDYAEALLRRTDGNSQIGQMSMAEYTQYKQQVMARYGFNERELTNIRTGTE